MRSGLGKIVCIGFCILGGSAGFPADAQTKRPAPRATVSQRPSFNQITSAEIVRLLADVAESNPMVLDRFRDDPEMRKTQLNSLRQLLAFASEAQREGLADKAPYSLELRNIRDEVTAVNYDRHLNKGKTAAVPFASITASRVAQYWGSEPSPKMTVSLMTEREGKFHEFLDTKVGLLKESNPDMADREITPAEEEQAREFYAKTQISVDDYKKRAPLLPAALRQKIDLQVKLQQAQFLARIYSEQAGLNSDANDAEIAAYIKSHPDLDTTAQRNKANGILSRAKGGEDFAKLANEFSEDPGNKGENDQPQGGLYKDVQKGAMVEPFERAALALEPGQISPNLVESDFGFHIIKLERKGKAAGADSPETYDVRHILIATMVYPDGPDGRGVPINEHVKSQIKEDREQRLIEELVARNKVSVPADFVVPKAADPEAPATKPVAPKRRPVGKRS